MQTCQVPRLSLAIHPIGNQRDVMSVDSHTFTASSFYRHYGPSNCIQVGVEYSPMLFKFLFVTRIGIKYENKISTHDNRDS